jgi:hypothetical protein
MGHSRNGAYGNDAASSVIPSASMNALTSVVKGIRASRHATNTAVFLIAVFGVEASPDDISNRGGASIGVLAFSEISIGHPTPGIHGSASTKGRNSDSAVLHSFAHLDRRHVGFDGQCSLTF